jgi:hypothetical protein
LEGEALCAAQSKVNVETGQKIIHYHGGGAKAGK